MGEIGRQNWQNQSIGVPWSTSKCHQLYHLCQGQAPCEQWQEWSSCKSFKFTERNRLQIGHRIFNISRSWGVTFCKQSREVSSLGFPWFSTPTHAENLHKTSIPKDGWFGSPSQVKMMSPTSCDPTCILYMLFISGVISTPNGSFIERKNPVCGYINNWHLLMHVCCMYACYT